MWGSNAFPSYGEMESSLLLISKERERELHSLPTFLPLTPGIRAHFLGSEKEDCSGVVHAVFALCINRQPKCVSEHLSPALY